MSTMLLGNIAMIKMTPEEEAGMSHVVIDSNWRRQGRLGGSEVKWVSV